MKAGMTRIGRSVVGVATALLSATAAQSGPVQQLVGADANGVLYDIDTNTGLASNPRDTGLGRLFGLTFDSSSGSLFGLGGISSGDIYRIDPDSGAAEATPWSLPGRVWNALTFDSSLGTFYANGAFPGGSGNLVTAFSPASGAIVNFPALNGSRAPLAVDASGRLFLLAYNGDGLLELDPANGSVLSTTPLLNTYSFPVTLAIDGENNFFSSDYISIGGINSVYRLDPRRGERTQLGMTGLSGTRLDYMVVVPEPSGIALILLTLIALIKMRCLPSGIGVGNNRCVGIPNRKAFQEVSALSVALALSVLLSPVSSAAAAPIQLTAITQSGILYDIDLGTGAASNARATSLGSVGGLATSFDNRLIANTLSPNLQPPTIAKLEVASGSVLQQLPFTWNAGDLDLDPSTGSLVGATLASGGSVSRLFTVSSDLSHVSSVGIFSAQPSGVAVDSSGALLAVDPNANNLLFLDKLNASIMTTSALSVDIAWAVMTFDSLDRLWLIDSSASGGTLYRVDPMTGKLATVGLTNVNERITGFAVVPEPASWILFSALIACSFVKLKTRNLRFVPFSA